VHLVRQLERWGVALIDCQVASAHLASLGARDIRRREFLARLAEALAAPPLPARWQLDPDLVETRVL
jgi:leucyl/phenylalanyl-tRNA--protein transferase